MGEEVDTGDARFAFSDAFCTLWKWAADASVEMYAFYGRGLAH